MGRLANMHEKDKSGRDESFNPILPSMQKTSEDQARACPLEGSSPYRINGDTSADEALKKIRTANSISISPG